MTKPLTLWITINCGKFLKRWEYQATWPTSWKILYAGQQAAVRIGHGTIDWFQIGKGVCQGCILSPCLFNFYAEYITWNAGLDEGQSGNKIARSNINNLKYADDTTLMAESEEELKSLLMKVKEESEKAGLSCWASGLESSWQCGRLSSICGGGAKIHHLGVLHVLLILCPAREDPVCSN